MNYDIGVSFSLSMLSKKAIKNRAKIISPSAPKTKNKVALCFHHIYSHVKPIDNLPITPNNTTAQFWRKLRDTK